jgi:hypothetical protein
MPRLSFSIIMMLFVRMDIEKFLELRPEWAQNPCLYIVRQMATENPGAHRCGASGTFLVPNQVDLDVPYRSDSAILKGLLGRMVMYQNYWLPIRGKIFAALRVKRALVAEPHQRVGEDTQGNTYNITKGNQTLVLTREKEFHAELDNRGYRWQKNKRNELFVGSRRQLEAALRTIRGESMYLFTETGWFEDEIYKGGSRTPKITIIDTSNRQQPDRVARAPSIMIQLSKEALFQLRAGNPQQFEKLLNLIREFDEYQKDTTVIQAPADVVNLLHDKNANKQVVQQIVTCLNGGTTPLRRSARLAKMAKTQAK